MFNNGGTSLGTNNAAGTPANGLYVLGNTGLGVNNPIEKLEVGGNMNIIGEIKANGLAGEQGQLLQSNGNGTMSWIEPCGYQYSEDFFNTTNPQSWTVPTGVTEIMVEMWGAGGGGSSNYGGGGGGYMKIKRLVTPGEVITFQLEQVAPEILHLPKLLMAAQLLFLLGQDGQIILPEEAVQGPTARGAIVLLIHRQLCSCEEEGSMGIPKR
ncbi:MAG: hypothetical protein IPH94_13660 [Saprospiraceae bacterium]|nr:hypothetical protein [Saprospiraceae bacterium]